MFADVLQNRCSEKFREFHRKISVLETPTQVFTNEIREIFKGTFPNRTPPVNDSDGNLLCGYHS